MTSSKELRTAEKEMRKADKQFAAAEKAYEKGNVKAGEKHENRANALAASAQEHAAHAQQVGILATGVTAPHSVHGGHHGAFSNNGAWNGGFMNVAPTTAYNGTPIGNYNPTHTYAQDHPYHHSNFSHNGTPLGQYNVGSTYAQDHPYSNATARAATTAGLTTAAVPLATATPLTSGLTSATPLGTGLASGSGVGAFGPHHGSYSNGLWNGGFMNTSPSTQYQGHPIGNYDPFHSYAAGHPYHHSNYQYNGQPLGQYQAGTTYPSGHPYHGIGSGLTSGLGGGLASGLGSGLGAGSGLGVSPFGQYHNTGGFYNVAPTTLYQGQAIGRYNPATAYAKDHPYHHSNFQYNGQPLGAYQAGTTYPQGHPYHGFGSTGTGLTSVLGSGLGSGVSPFGAHHNNGGFYNVAPTTLYQGQPIGNYNPLTSYAQGHPYHHSNFQYNGQPLGAYQSGTTYPQGHPYHGFGSSGTTLGSGLGSGLVGSTLGSGLGSSVSPFGAHHNNGGFYNVAPTTLYQGQPIGNFNPLTSYAQGHPYHHSNFQYNGQPLEAYQSGTTYPQGHPYHGFGSSGSGLGSGLTSGLGAGLVGSSLASPFGAHHNNGGFFNVAPTTQYQGQAIGNYNPLTSYPQGHPYHHSNFQYNGQPLGAYQAGTVYPQGHPYHGFGTGSGLSSGLSGLSLGNSPFGQHHGTGGFYNVAPTTLYQNQPIGNYNPLTSYPAGHPYHHSNFQYQGQPLQAYQAGTTYPQGHPYYGFGDLSRGVTGAPTVTGHTYVPYTSPFGQHHGTWVNDQWVGGLFNVAPSTIYNGHAIGNYNPSFNYPQDHPYHHSHHTHGNAPLQPYAAGTNYPQGHPFYGRGLNTTTGGLASGITNVLGSGVGGGLGTGAGLSGLGSHGLGRHHGSFANGKWQGGFMDVDPIVAYNGQPIGNYDPNFDYPADHPYHHSKFQHNGQPLGRFQRGTQYPQGHPYYGIL